VELLDSPELFRTGKKIPELNDDVTEGTKLFFIRKLAEPPKMSLLLISDSCAFIEWNIENVMHRNINFFMC